jgi:hypothetical protein
MAAGCGLGLLRLLTGPMATLLLLLLAGPPELALACVGIGGSPKPCRCAAA